MKILVTGGAGFIGSNFIKLLLKNNSSDSIINLDNLTYSGNLDNLKDVENNNQYRFIKGDICDRNLVNSIFMEGVDWVFNLAAETHVDRSIEDSAPFLTTNVIGTHTLLEATKKYNVKRFIHISTDEVYGSLGKEGYFTENSPIQPNNPYSASKASSDLLVKAYYETFGMDVVITRCSNNYGPYQYPEKLIPLFISNALADKPVPIYGDGLNIRDWIYVEDHCQAILMVAQKGKSGEVYNIGTDSELTNLEMTDKILELLNKPQSLKKFVTDRKGHDHRYAIDSSKIKNEIGWEPMITFEMGIKKTIEWYKSKLTKKLQHLI